MKVMSFDAGSLYGRDGSLRDYRRAMMDPKIEVRVRVGTRCCGQRHSIILSNRGPIRFPNHETSPLHLQTQFKLAGTSGSKIEWGRYGCLRVLLAMKKDAALPEGLRKAILLTEPMKAMVHAWRLRRARKPPLRPTWRRPKVYRSEEVRKNCQPLILNAYKAAGLARTEAPELFAEYRLNIDSPSLSRSRSRSVVLIASSWRLRVHGPGLTIARSEAMGSLVVLDATPNGDGYSGVAVGRDALDLLVLVNVHLDGRGEPSCSAPSRPRLPERIRRNRRTE